MTSYSSVNWLMECLFSVCLTLLAAAGLASRVGINKVDNTPSSLLTMPL